MGILKIKIKHIYSAIVDYNKRKLAQNINELADINKERIVLFHHSRLVIFLKLVLLLSVIMLVFPYYVTIGRLLETGFQFFKLSEIFKFTLPGPAFFQSLARTMFFIIIGYYSLAFIIKLVEDFFSALAVSSLGPYRENSLGVAVADNTFFYIRNRLVSKKTYIFSTNDLDVFILKKNIISRLLKTGTIVLQKHNGQHIVISSLNDAEKAINYILKKSGQN